MEELLKRWAKAEPERCKNDGHGTWYVKRNGMWKRVTLIGGLDEDRIQGAAQESIKANRMSWTCRTRTVGTFLATIPSMGYVPSYNGLTEKMQAEGSTPAGAVLAVLLQAIEATKSEAA